MSKFTMFRLNCASRFSFSFYSHIVFLCLEQELSEPVELFDFVCLKVFFDNCIIVDSAINWRVRRWWLLIVYGDVYSLTVELVSLRNPPKLVPDK